MFLLEQHAILGAVKWLWVVLLFVLIQGCSASGVAPPPGKPVSPAAEARENKVTIFMSPDCSCCHEYVAYLKKQGFRVEEVVVPDMLSVKNKYEIPGNMISCHTGVIGGYFVEGHMPVEAIEKLWREKPAIGGIALPGMPSGSPGMPGPKLKAFELFAISNGRASLFMTL